MSNSRDGGSGKTGAAVGFLAVVAAYKLAMIGLGHPLAWVAGFAIDVALVAAAWLTATWLERTAFSWSRVASGIFFGVALVAWFIPNFAYTYFFKESTGRHYSLLNVTMSEVRLFVQELLPLTGWLLLVGLTVAALAAAAWSRRYMRVDSMRRPVLGSVLVAVVASALAWTTPDVPHPAMDIARDLKGRNAESPIAVADDTAPVPSFALFDRSAMPAAPIKTRFKKIIVIVMESMPFDTYHEELAPLPKKSFLNRVEARGHSFDRYYTPNQDSRTAMLDMLVSRFIPYEAYDDEGLTHYKSVSRLGGLPAALHANGYETSYVFAQQDSETVVSDLPWQKIMSLRPEEIAKFKTEQHALCFNPFEFENSCEDKVMLPRVVDFVAANNKAFVYQELMWGHALEYNTASGKSNVQYINEYADTLWRLLEKKHLTDQTLLVITGDHGSKAQDRLAMPVNYQVPLFFFAKKMKPRRESGMYTHLDFEQLLFRELEPSRPAVPTTPFVHIVGPTNSQLRAVMDATGNFFVYRQRGEQSFVTYASGKGPTKAATHLRMFEAYRRWFNGAITPVPAAKPRVLADAK
jgi:hypothetical protein